MTRDNARSRPPLTNDPADAVDESVRGLLLAYPELLTMTAGQRVVVRTAPTIGKVGVLSGGGSGHEPLHAGYVGRGMLDAACPGEVFTSPPVPQILAGIHAADSGAGVIQIIKNYAGDVMNFRLAAQLAADEGIEVAEVIVTDDVAISTDESAQGRRGVAGTVLVEKIAGAAAERGMNLTQIRSIAQHVAAGARSFGFALSSVTVPGSSQPILELSDEEAEIGVGIHGEPGRHRGTRPDARGAADLLVEAVTSELGSGQAGNERDVLVLLNGFGGLSNLELFLLYGQVHERLNADGWNLRSRLVGNYVTSLDMAGASLTMLSLDDELTGLWNDPVHTPALRWGC